MVTHVDARYENGRIVCSADFSEISRIVHEECVAILKGVFDPDELAVLRDKVFAWAQRTKSQVHADRSFHRIDDFPPRSEAPHMSHFHHLVLCEGYIEDDLAGAVSPYFSAMRDLQNSLTDNKADFTPDSDGRLLLPQVFQYPSGGGCLGKHSHSYLPQKIGLIVEMAQKGKDYNSGGNCFETDGQVIDIEGEHEAGDIALFRYDIPHWVTPVDSDESVDWGSPRGRWTMVLPFYHHDQFTSMTGLKLRNVNLMRGLTSGERG